MELVVALVGDASADAAQALAVELARDDAWRGRVRLIEGPPEPGTLGGTLGSITRELLLSVTAGGGVAGLVRAVVSFVRHHPSDIEVTFGYPDGGPILSVAAKHLKSLRIDELTPEVERLARLLAVEPPAEAQAPGRPAGPPPPAGDGGQRS